MESHVPGRYRHAGAVVVAVLLAASQASLSADIVRVYQVEDLGFIGDANYLVGVAVNVPGDVAGWATGSDGVLRAFRWTASGGLEDLGTHGGQAAMATSINDNGDVAGHYWDQDGLEHPFIARRGEAMTI
jgi:probable HAF family extracellular repeat protein